MVAKAKETNPVIGEMISRGEVKFESRQNVWKIVEPSHFPIFEGIKIKIGKGASIITLENNSQVEVGQNSLLSFDRSDQIGLIEGTVDFRFPPTAELSFKVEGLTVIKHRSLQASKNPVPVSPNGEDTIGSISVHPNGAITVKSIRGSLAVLNQGRVILAALSPENTVTLPSATVKVPPRKMLAQAGKKTINLDPKSSNFLGIPDWGWAAIVTAVGITASIVVIAATNDGDGDRVAIPICP
jgi:hypothetical protein